MGQGDADAAAAGLAALTVRISRRGAVTTLTLSGELDLANAEAVRRAAARLAADGCDEVEVEASELAFLDAAGLGALVHLQQQVAQHGGHLHVTGLRPFQRRVIALARLDGLLGVS